MGKLVDWSRERSRIQADQVARARPSTGKKYRVFKEVAAWL